MRTPSYVVGIVQSGKGLLFAAKRHKTCAVVAGVDVFADYRPCSLRRYFPNHRKPPSICIGEVIDAVFSISTGAAPGNGTQNTPGVLPPADASLAVQ